MKKTIKLLLILSFINFPIFSDPKATVNYRGNRMSFEEDCNFQLTSSSISKLNNNKIQLDLEFNKEIDPRSVDKDSILINEKKVKNQIMFSRNGKTMRVIISDFNEEIDSIKIKNVYSFDEIKLNEITIN